MPPRAENDTSSAVPVRSVGLRPALPGHRGSLSRPVEGTRVERPRCSESHMAADPRNRRSAPPARFAGSSVGERNPQALGSQQGVADEGRPPFLAKAGGGWWRAGGGRPGGLAGDGVPERSITVSLASSEGEEFVGVGKVPSRRGPARGGKRAIRRRCEEKGGCQLVRSASGPSFLGPGLPTRGRLPSTPAVPRRKGGNRIKSLCRSSWPHAPAGG